VQLVSAVAVHAAATNEPGAHDEQAMQLVPLR
jgi:hypothetical protein